jgi:hypothetical protein
MVDTTGKRKEEEEERKRERERQTPGVFYIAPKGYITYYPFTIFLFICCAVYQHILPNNNPLTRYPSNLPSLPALKRRTKVGKFLFLWDELYRV